MDSYSVLHEMATLWCVLVLLLGAASGSEAQCSGSTSRVEFTVTSVKNGTTHRDVAASLLSEVPADSQEPQPVALKVAHWTQRCGGTETVAMDISTASSVVAENGQNTTSVITATSETTSTLAMSTMPEPSTPGSTSTLAMSTIPEPSTTPGSTSTLAMSTIPEPSTTPGSNMSTMPEPSTTPGSTSTLAMSTMPEPSTTPGVSVPRFQSGYQKIPGFGEYKLHGSDINWNLANRTCVDEGAHLVVMETEEEMDAVKEMVRSEGPSFARYSLWTGVYRDNSSSPWMTVLGHPLGSSVLWWRGYPKESGDCVRFETAPITRGNSNRKCDFKEPFLCEK